MDLYSAFIVVPHTQGTQVRITQCYLQITPYTCLYLVSIHQNNQMAHPRTEVADIAGLQPTTHLSTPNATVPDSARDCDEAVTGRKWALRNQKRASGGPLHFVFGLFMVCYDALCPTCGPVEEYGRSIQGRNYV